VAVPGHKRPDFATVPVPGQQSVWGYPRPPKLASDSRLVEVYSGDQVAVSSVRTCRVLEAASLGNFMAGGLQVKSSVLSRESREADIHQKYKGLISRETNAVNHFRKDVIPEDDITLVVIKVTG